MSSVFLSNVDDYLGPSQACVNPLFSTDKPTSTGNSDVPSSGEGAVRTRTRRTLVRGPGISEATSTVQTNDTTEAPKQVNNSVVQASIADCLACSGCVTTAETVLLEEKHSIEKLRQWIRGRLDASSSLDDKRKRLVITISPASWADLMRHLDSSSTVNNSNNSSIRDRQQQLASFFHQYWTADVIMDANVPLEWSRLAAAQSFVQAYRQQPASKLPQLASSCPATVCLIEKSIHAAVPHLSHIPSPMSCAGAYWKQQDDEVACFHLAVMPCHDKKLEASRTEFATGTEEEEQLVDMSITTTECWQLMQDFCIVEETKTAALATTTHQQHIAEVLSHLPHSKVYTSVQEWKAQQKGNQHQACLIVPQETKSVKRDTTIPNSTFFVESSGGYADFIFRYAARELFQTDVPIQPTKLWQPYREVEDSSKKTMVSARIASQKRRREFLHATLHHHPSTGTYSTNPPRNTKEDDDSRPVLRFAIANGMQTIQRALKPFQEDDQVVRRPPFDYMEIMACPSGCINGGGQIRTAVRETPTETRERIWNSQELYFQAPSVSSVVEIPLSAEQKLHTQYRVIAPMQHTLGAAAGIEVKDAIW